MRLHRGGIELGAENVADGIALESAAEAAAIPMDVLQAAVAIVGRRDAEILLHAGAPRLRQVFHLQPAFQQVHLEIETHHDVEIVGHLVGVGADQRAFDPVDGAIEGLRRDGAERIGEGVLQHRIKMLPEATTAPDHVFPQPRLALVHACRRPVAQRSAVERGGDALLVERMAGLVDDREQRIADVVRIDPAW